MKRYSLIVICLFFVGFLRAQQEDFQTWWSASLGFKPAKNLVFELTPELRFEDNSRSQNTFLTEISAEYELLKFFKAGALYRFELEKNTDSYTSQINRYMIYGQFKTNINRLKLFYRPGYQIEYSDYGKSENGNIPLKQHRHKIALKYPIRKSDFTPHAAIEGFFTLSPLEKVNEVKARVTVGIDYDISDKMVITLVYRYQQEYWENEALTSSIIGVSFSYLIDTTK